MRTARSRGVGSLLFISILLTGLVLPTSASAYNISFYHYVFATGGEPPLQDDGLLENGPLSLYESFTHSGEPLAPNEARANYFADIDAGTLGAQCSAAGGVTDFWPFGFTATGRVEYIGFQVDVSYLVPAGEYPEGVLVGATGRVTGSFSATYAASAQGRYTIQLGAGSHAPPLTVIGNDDDLILNVDDPFEVNHQLIPPGGVLPESVSIQITLSASFATMQTSTIREGTSPDYIVGSAEDSFYSGIEFTEMIVPEGVTWSTDTGVFLNEEDISAVGDTPRAAHLKGNFPNPFNPATTISYFLPEATNIALSVFDLSGHLVRVLEEGLKVEGTHARKWDGVDDSGHAVPSGIYIYSLEAGRFRESKKMMLVR